MYNESEELWNEVADYIYDAYDEEKIEKIYLSGDGANWIKAGQSLINKSIHVLDKYHLNRSIKQAGAHIENAEREIWYAIKTEDKEYLKIVIDTIIGATESETKIAAIKDSRRYILNHWKSLKYYSYDDYAGCSAEGHISHIYSDRLSSRPLGWSREGIDQMARLRVYKANGGNVFDITLKKKQERKRNKRIEAFNLKYSESSFEKVSGETFDNLPVLNAGKRSQLAFALRELRGI